MYEHIATDLKRLHRQLVLACVVALGVASASAETPAKHRLLWTDPGDIASRNLYYGVGGKDHVPQPPVKFLDEDKGGTNPKFDVRDQAGTKWKVKLGVESKPEVAASRLLWAVGYFANENYFVPDLEVDGLKHLKRGRPFVKGDHVESARLQRHPEGEKKVGKWDWRHNPFKGTQEFDGLRVMMALISNWDLKADNNAIYSDKEHPGVEDYEVTDVGTAFGTSGKSYTSGLSKSNIDAYRKHKFVSKVTADHVNLNFPTHPSFIHFFEFPPSGGKSPIAGLVATFHAIMCSGWHRCWHSSSRNKFVTLFALRGIRRIKLKNMRRQSKRGSPT